MTPPFLQLSVNLQVPLPLQGDNIARSNVRSRRHAPGMRPGAFLPTIISANSTKLEVEVSVVSTPLFEVYYKKMSPILRSRSSFC